LISFRKPDSGSYNNLSTINSKTLVEKKSTFNSRHSSLINPVPSKNSIFPGPRKISDSYETSSFIKNSELKPTQSMDFVRKIIFLLRFL